MTSFRGQASQAKMMSLGGKLTALLHHQTKKVNKADELTYLSTNIGCYDIQHNNIQYEITQHNCLFVLTLWMEKLNLMTISSTTLSKIKIRIMLCLLTLCITAHIIMQIYNSSECSY
jgi:hypothetical protein